MKRNLHKTAEQTGFSKAVVQSFTLKRTPLEWATFALTLAVVWLFYAGFIMLMTWRIPQTRSEWIFLVLVGPPAWVLTELFFDWLSKTELYRVFSEYPSPIARIVFGVIFFGSLMLVAYILFMGCSWLMAKL